MDVDGSEIMRALSPFCITIGHEISGIHLEWELPKKTWSSNIVHPYKTQLFGKQNPTRWWFQVFFIFIPILGKISNLTNICQMGWNHQPANPQRTQTKTDTAGHSEHDMVKVRSDVRAVRLECREARQSFVFTFQDLKASKKNGLVKGLYMGLTIYTQEIWHRYQKLTYFNGVTFQTIIFGYPAVSFRGFPHPGKLTFLNPKVMKVDGSDESPNLIFGVNSEVQNVFIFQGVGDYFINDAQATIQDPHINQSVFLMVHVPGPGVWITAQGERCRWWWWGPS